MNVTRENHLKYMTKMTPLLILAYVIQSLVYRQFIPGDLATDFTIFLGVGLVLIIICFQYYDQNHKVILKENFLEVRFDILKMHQEVLYQNIDEVEVKRSRHSFAHVTLHLRDGSSVKLHHIDSPELIQQAIARKNTRCLTV
ncbi:MAG TPA: hypothetical protein VNJ01_05745 [Bacteriovoracaceae bacterium]|nr:hypothetical protein [Bacteriovoracaceae bacterium]